MQASLVASNPLLDSIQSLAVCCEFVEFSQAARYASEQRAVKGSSGLRQSVELPLAIGANLHQFGITKDGEVARDFRLELVQNLAKVADTNFLLRAEKVQNPQASRVREGAKEVRGQHIHKIEYVGVRWLSQDAGGRDSHGLRRTGPSTTPARLYLMLQVVGMTRESCGSRFGASSAGTGQSHRFSVVT